ncbi:hypothetical protein E1B28_008675 [Marasmius oreades]|uniref:Uncharacterized protein n=1 Tax=Marasmius oreades TaxID=181124 RepID=A0A9P7USC7_9AGAR|nr:uncharacterized protein E1B28_008675 [Marasmius oreades]KAG7092313.1 hypothetical protein E1B28_008675 [Marasmius oreades]
MSSFSLCLRRTLLRQFSSTPLRAQVPWFIEEPEQIFSTPAPLQRLNRARPIPEDAPIVLRDLHSQLLQSPHLEPSELLITRAADIRPPLGAALPLRRPQGRRKRGGTDAGESMYDIPGSLWNWMVFAQVKEGTESKGAIESVVRVVRRTLLQVHPPLPLPPNSKRRMQNGWAMIDGGDFAVHVISKVAREKYFTKGLLE